MSPTSEAAVRCKRHPKDAAGWRCDVCKSALCAACTSRLLTYFYCGLCEERASQITIHRTTVPFIARLIDAVTYPVRGGLRWLVPAALFLTFVSYAAVKALDPDTEARWSGSPPAAAGAAAPARRPKTDTGPGDPAASKAEKPQTTPPSAYVIPPVRAVLVLMFAFLIAVSTARRGRSERGIVLPTVKLLATTAIVFAPGVAYVVLVRRAPPDLAMLRDQMLWVLAGLGIVYLPVAMAGAASDASFFEVLNPFRVFDWASRVGKRYVLTVLSLAVLGCVAAGLSSSAARVRQRVQTPIVGSVLAELVALCLIAAMARLVGALLYFHGEAFDWGMPSDYLDPVLRGVDAKGTYKGAARTTAGAARTTPVEGVPGAGAPRQKTEKELAKQVHNALLDNNVPRAIRLYLARPKWDGKLFDQNQLFTMGNTARRAKNLDGAIRLLTDAIEAKGSIASRVLVVLAQIYGDDLKNPEKAGELYRLVIEKHPQSDGARLATKKLQDPEPEPKGPGPGAKGPSPGVKA